LGWAFGLFCGVHPLFHPQLGDLKDNNKLGMKQIPPPKQGTILKKTLTIRKYWLSLKDEKNDKNEKYSNYFIAIYKVEAI